MSLSPSANSAIDASCHKCSNYCSLETCVSALTNSLNYSPSDVLSQQQVILENFQNETVPSGPPLYSSKMNKASLVVSAEQFSGISDDRGSTDNILLSSGGTPDDIELQKYLWKCVQNQEESGNYINESKSYVPESNHFLREIQDAACDKNYPSGELYEEVSLGHPHKNTREIKPIECFPDDYSTDNYSTSVETVTKIVDDGVEVAWMDIKRIKTTEGFHFSCSLCYAVFKSESNAILHLQDHGITKPYKCLWCEISSQTESEAKVHYSGSHTGITMLCCDCCDRQFPKEEMLQRHKAECGPSVGSLSPYLQSHISKSSVEYTTSSEEGDERSEETITSTTRNVKESPQNYASDEKDDSDNQNSNDCSSPTTNTSSDNNILANYTTVYSDNNPAIENNTGKKNSNKAQKNFQCLTCGKAFRASKPLKEHEVVHTGAREFPCEICGKAFGTRANKKIHLATHSDRRPFSCNVCNASFRQKDSLKVHLRKHNGERPFACTVCSMTFDRSFTWKNHILTHKEERSHVCAVCGKAFTTRGGLNNHEKLHLKDPSQKKARKPPSKPGTGNWICDECGKLYSTRSNLKMHQRSHEPTAVTHTCYVCGRVYKHKDSLEVHMRKHKDERPYSCPTCGRNFYRNGTLKLHLLTHTGEKPHKCPLDGCDKAFTQSSSLYNHVQSHYKQLERLKKKNGSESAQCTSEGVVLPSNSVSNINKSESLVMNAVQSLDTLPNNQPPGAPALYLVDSQNRNPALSDQVDNMLMPSTSLSLDTSTFSGDDLSVRVGVEEVHPSALNGLVVNGHSVSMTPEVPLLQRQADEISQSTHLNLVTHNVVDPVGALCPSNVPSNLVWDTTILPMGLNNITTDINMPQSDQTDSTPLQSFPQSLDPSLYVLPEHVPLLISVDGHLYQQDTHLKMAGLQNNFVSQLH